MNNQEILKALRARRDISNFAKFINITPQGLYKLLKSEKKKDNQYYNFIRFILNKYLESL